MTNKPFKVEYISGNRAWCYCHRHNDTTRPNLSISLDTKYYGRYKCWACGTKGKLSKAKMKSLELDKFKSHYSNKKCSPNWARLQYSYWQSLNKLPLLKQGLCTGLNIDIPTLSSWNIGYDGSAFTIPMYSIDASSIICGIQRRFPNGQKSCMQGSKLGIFHPIDIWSDEPLYICEGFSDTINLNNLGFNVIGMPSCHFVKETTEFIDYLCPEEDIIIVPDNDEVGQKAGQELYDELSKYESCYIFEYERAKDIREWIKLVGKDKAIYKLVRYYND